MSENPKCPYCGEEMRFVEDDNPMWYRAFYVCDGCGCRSSYARNPQSAYTAAMKRERVKGEWIDFGDELDKSAGRHSYQCSRCFTDASYFISGFEWDEWTAPHYCPNCGADMRKEANDERES